MQLNEVFTVISVLLLVIWPLLVFVIDYMERDAEGEYIPDWDAKYRAERDEQEKRRGERDSTYRG